MDLLLQEFQSAWDEHPADTITYPKSESRDSNGHLAGRLLRAFLESDLSRPVGRIIGIEEELRGCLIDGVPDLLARLDLLTESDDAITVTDFKTSRSTWSAEQAADAAEQLFVYGVHPEFHRWLREFLERKWLAVGASLGQLRLCDANCPRLAPTANRVLSLRQRRQSAEQFLDMF